MRVNHHPWCRQRLWKTPMTSCEKFLMYNRVRILFQDGMNLWYSHFLQKPMLLFLLPTLSSKQPCHPPYCSKSRTLLPVSWKPSSCFLPITALLTLKGKHYPDFYTLIHFINFGIYTYKCSYSVLFFYTWLLTLNITFIKWLCVDTVFIFIVA